VIADIASITVWLELLQATAGATALLVDEHILSVQAQLSEDSEALDRIYLRGARRYVKSTLKAFASFNYENGLDDIVDEIAKKSVQHFLRQIKKQLMAKDSPVWTRMEEGGAGND